MMGVYIKGMKMPKNCCECWFMEGADEWCCAHRGRYLEPDYRYGIKDKPDWCPLVEVPPHGRLIDADEISEHKYATIPPHRKEYCDGKPKSEEEVIAFKFGWNDAIDAITENAPTIIEAEEDE